MERPRSDGDGRQTAEGKKKTDRQSDRQTDGRTDGQTDRQQYVRTNDTTDR